MATANKETVCSICGKSNGRVRCEGCSKLFCLNDFTGHRQDLSAQLDEIEVTRDLFRQTLTETISKPQNHALIQHIQKWENESIDRIRQAAREASEILFKHIVGFNAQLEEKLNILTNQLRQSREENDYFEPNLNQWREQLAKMKNELAQPTNVTIQNDSKPFVTKIIVDISDGSRQSNASKPKTGVLCQYCRQTYQREDSEMHKANCRQNPANYSKNRQLSTDEDFNQNSDRSRSSESSDDHVRIPCEWCNEEIPSTNYERHAIVCRDKEHKRLEEELDRRDRKSTPISPAIQSTGPLPVRSYASVFALPTPSYATCEFCGLKRSLQGISYHQLNCKMNPRRSRLQ